MRLPKIRQLLKLLWMGGAVLFLSSCSTIPQERYTALAEQERQLLTEWPVQEESAKEATVLKELISDPELDSLIDEALQANPNLQQTVLTLKILGAQRRQTTADRLPKAQVDMGADKDEGDEESYSGSLSISWEVDLWKKLADSEGAAVMDEAEQRALLEAARTAQLIQKLGWKYVDESTPSIYQVSIIFGREQVTQKTDTDL